MTSDRSQRRDAAENRERLLVAAREVFAGQGAAAPLEAVAAAAGVSRTTLYRHFASREALAATVFEDNLERIAELAEALRGRPGGVTELFDVLLEMTRRDRSLVGVLVLSDAARLAEYGERTMALLDPLLEEGREQGLVRPDVTAADLLVTIRMIDAVLSPPGPDADALFARACDLARRSLFTD